MPNPTTAAEWAHELLETLLSAVERLTRKPIQFPGPIVARPSGEQEEPMDCLKRVAEQRLDAYARQQVEEAFRAVVREEQLTPQGGWREWERDQVQ